MHKQKTGGGFDYWYPGTGVGNVHQDDAPAPTKPAEPAPAPPVPTPASTTSTTSPGGVDPRAAALPPEGSPSRDPSRGDTEAAPPRVPPSRSPRKPRAPAPAKEPDEARATERHPADEYPERAGPLRLGQSLQEAEIAIANEAHEHACVFAGDGRQLGRFDPVSTRALARHADTRKACAVPLEVQNAIRADGNGIFTHNHPSGGPISPDDIEMAIYCNAKEMRATTRDGVWILSRPARGWPDRHEVRIGMNKDVGMEMNQAYVEMNRIVTEAGGNIEDGSGAKGFSAEKWQQLCNEATIRAWKTGTFLPKRLPLRWEPHPDRRQLAPDVRSQKPRREQGMNKGGSLRLLVDLARLRKAAQMGLFGGETTPKAPRGRAGAGGAPAGYTPIPGSAHGGYRKPHGDGGYHYWYPPSSGVLRDKTATKGAALEMLRDHPLSVQSLTYRVAPEDQSGAPAQAIGEAVRELHREGKLDIGNPNASGNREYRIGSGGPRPKVPAADRDHRTADGVAREELHYGPGTAGDRAPLAKAQVRVRGHYAHDPHGGIHQVRAHSRYGPIPDGAAPFGPHANWLAAHNKLLAASTARLGEGRYAQARALYDLAHHVRWTHDATFDMSNRIEEDPGAPMHKEASKAYYAMYHPKERHPIEIFHGVMEGRNKNGRATKVHKHFERDRDYKGASEAFATDRSAIESWWRSKIASFEGNEELSKFVNDTIEKWRGGAKVAPTDPNRCDRCGGRGYLDAFKHVSGGECFECGGSGTKDTTMHEVLRKAMTLRMPVFDLEPLAKGTAGAGVLAVVGAGGTGDTWTVGAYNFRLSKGQSGVSILTVTGGNLPQPYHLVVRGRSDALAQSPGVAQAFTAGRVPDEGMFRREGLTPVRYGIA